jgi:hypothetical protein
MDEKRAMMEVAHPTEKLLLLMLNSLGGRRGTSSPAPTGRP